MWKVLNVAILGIVLVIASLSSYSGEITAPASGVPRLRIVIGKECAISVGDYFHGRLENGTPSTASYWTEEPPIATLVPKFAVDFVCVTMVDKSTAAVARDYGAAYDGRKKKWVPYFASQRDSKLLGAFTEVHVLETINGRGFYSIQDDRDGDPKQRERYLSFCIFHDVIAVCGAKPVMYLRDPKGNLLPYFLKILRSVEFVDTSESAPVSAALPATAR